MTTINELNSTTSFSTSDLLVVYSSNNGNARKTALSGLVNYLQSVVTVPNALLKDGSVALTGNLLFGGKKGVNAGDGSAATDLVTVQQTLLRSGAQAMLGNLPMGGFKVTGALGGVAPTDLATVGQMSTALAGKAGTVSSIVALKALVPPAVNIVYLTALGREGLFEWKVGDYSVQIALDTQNGIYVKADLIASNLGSWVRKIDGELNLKWFGGVGDDSTLNDTAIAAWFSLVLYLGTAGYAPAGSYVTANPVAFDYISKWNTGFTIHGDGVQKTIFRSTYSVAGNTPAYGVFCSGGTVPSPKIGVYFAIRGIGFLSTFAGSTFDVGYYDKSDQQNRGWLDIWTSNKSDNAAARGIRFNNCYGCDFAFNGGVGTTTAAGAMAELRQCSFSFFFISCGSTADVGGNAVGTAIGVYITNGFSYGNTFVSPDLEILYIAVKIDSGAAQNNVFLGGTYAGLIDSAVFATAGNNNQFVSPNKNASVGFFKAGTGNAVGVFKTAFNQIDIVSPATGTTVNLTETARFLKINNGAGIATLTIALPLNPGDGQQVEVHTLSAITALTVTGGAFDPPTTLVGGTGFRMQWSSPNGLWFRCP